MLYVPHSAAPHYYAGAVWHNFRRDWLKPVAMVIVLIVFMNLFFPRYAVHGHSMEPNLHESDRLFVTSIDLVGSTLQRGEMVILISPYDGENIVKRVIGLPGETVDIHGGQVYINGQVLVERYITDPPRYSGHWVVGDDEVFVLGDNRNNSLDSADYGPVDITRLTGIVRFRFLPLTDFSLFNMPDYSRP